MEDKRKYLFHLPNAQTLYLAGIYEQEQDECRYCTLTTEANESVRGVHHRMPEVAEGGSQRLDYGAGSLLQNTQKHTTAASGHG